MSDADAPAAPATPPPAAVADGAPSSAGRAARWWTLSRQAWLVFVVALAVLVPRGATVARVQSIRADDAYHLARGIRYWHRAIPKDWPLNDPPLGQAVSAIPILRAAELAPGRRASLDDVYRQMRHKRFVQIAEFKSALFAPAVVLVFWWVAGIYGAAAGWLAAAMLLVDPTFAAHIPLPAIDVLGVEAILLGCYAAWRCAVRPTAGRAAVAGAACAAAMMTKHTAVILPAVAVALAGVAPVVRWWHPTAAAPAARGLALRDGVRLACIGAASLVMGIWALTMFDVRRPYLSQFWPSPPPWWAAALTRHHLPAGVYVASFLDGMAHAQWGHPGMLLGQIRQTGWWYYFPVVATMKVPLGFFAVALLGVGSLAVVRPRWREWSLVIPAVAWTALMLHSNIDIGFRHFLPAYVFLLMLSARCLAARGAWWRVAAWCGVTWAAAHAASFGPADYLSYVNRDIDKVWLRMDDSNLDWGQGALQVRDWVTTHVPPGRPTAVAYQFPFFVHPSEVPPGVVVQQMDMPLPTRGLFIVSPDWVTGQYDPEDRMRALRQYEPVAVIAHHMLVFDLDLLGGGNAFDWSKAPPPLQMPR